MACENFFEERSDESRIKAELVDKYFRAWARVIRPTVERMGGRIAYIDLFAGPGRYTDGAASVPLMVVQNAIDDAFLCQHLVTIFNDKDSNNTRTLESQILQIPGISKLRFAPRVYNEEVSDRIAKLFEETKLAPTLFFVDPWGYKGLSLRLVNSVLKDWGSDCIFFFNYNRINMGLGNAVVRERMEALFGSDRATHLRNRLAGMAPACREIAIVEEISTALKEMGGRYVVPFCFKNEVGTRSSHYLIFVSKHVKGYEIMKDVMAAASSMVNQGVPTLPIALRIKLCLSYSSLPVLLISWRLCF